MEEGQFGENFDIDRYPLVSALTVSSNQKSMLIDNIYLLQVLSVGHHICMIDSLEGVAFARKPVISIDIGRSILPSCREHCLASVMFVYGMISSGR